MQHWYRDKKTKKQKDNKTKDDEFDSEDVQTTSNDLLRSKKGGGGGGAVSSRPFDLLNSMICDLKRSVDLRCLFDHRCYIHPFRWSCSRINSQCSSLGDLGLRGWWRRIDAQTTVTVDHEWVRRSFDAIWWRHPSLSGKSPIELVKLRKKSSIRGGGSGNPKFCVLFGNHFLF